MELKGKKVTVFGLAKSGIAAARRLASLGAKVLVTDIKPTSEAADDLKALGIEVELGGHTDKAIDGAELIVVSPGIHLDIPLLIEAKRRQIPVIAEIELAYRLLNKPIVALTGTNGKTTTTTLIGEMLKAGGKKIAVAGNIGFPLIEVDETGLDWIVVEVSSYQLEGCVDFKPHISLILNIQPDHLERHGSMGGYIEQKARIFMNQTGDDYLVYNEDDPEVKKMVQGARCRVLGFSIRHPEIITLKPEDIRIPGKHNLSNSLAAAQAAYLCGVSKATVAEVLRTFPGVEHRIEYVATVDGVKYYNDSKGTNPDSTLVAIDTFAGQGIILLLGGRDKGTPLGPLCQKIKEQVKAVVTLGEAAERFEQALRQSGFSAVQNAGHSLAEAVQQARVLAKQGDLVLFSPACASFDLFNNYEERGRAFKQIVINEKTRQ